MYNVKLYSFFIIVCFTLSVYGSRSYQNFVSDFTVELVKSKHTVLIGCSVQNLMYTTKQLVSVSQTVSTVNIDKSQYYLTNILSRYIYAKTTVVIDCNCKNYKKILHEASDLKYFNKTYQWLVIDYNNFGALNIFKDIQNVALNSQITYVNQSNDDNFVLYDIYSKGRHIKSPIEITRFGKWSSNKKFTIFINIIELQGIKYRNNFNGLKLRGGIVIDRKNITSNTQVDQLLTSQTKTDGVTPFSKYHYALVGILQQYLNFSVDYRVTRGWAVRLPNSSFRLGLLGIVKRNEVDVAASAVLVRLNRFAEFDNIHQEWLFEAAFIFMYTSKLNSGSGAIGNFISPFDIPVWILSIITLILIALFWKAFETFAKRFNIDNDKQYIFGNVSLQSFGAVCQQGINPPPNATTARIIALTLITYSFVLYNYYTSSVVGGLLSSNNQGPKNLNELTDSPLALSFEDVPYNRVLFKESNLRAIVKKIYRKQIQPTRKANDLTQFAQLNMAIKFIKQGTHGFHCELVSAYDDIARVFDTNEICKLRFIGGLFPVTKLSMILTKRSQYTETFRTIFHKAREFGLIQRELKRYHTERPKCQGGLTIEPVSLESIISSLYILAGGILMSGLTLGFEIIWKKIV